MASQRSPLALCIDVVVDRRWVRREHLVWIALYLSMARVREAQVARCPVLFLAPQLLGKRAQLVLRITPRQRPVDIGRGRAAHHLRTKPGLAAPNDGRTGQGSAAVNGFCSHKWRYGLGPALPRWGRGLIDRQELATDTGW